MPAIGFGLLWSGYTLLFWGFCKIKGYDIGLLDITVPKHYKGAWPPPLVDDGITKRMGRIPGHEPKSAPATDPGSSGSSGSGTSGGSMFV